MEVPNQHPQQPPQQYPAEQRSKSVGRSNSYINPPTNIYNHPPNNNQIPPSDLKNTIYGGNGHYNNNGGVNLARTQYTMSHVQNGGNYGRLPVTQSNVAHAQNVSAASNAFLHNTMSSSNDMLNTSTSDIPQNATLRYIYVCLSI